MPTERKEITLLIDSLGAQGDGLGSLEGRPVYVAGALAGETVIATGKSAKLQLASIVTASNERVEPFCRHFSTCGGCQVQHLSNDAYVRWKTSLLTDAFSRVGIEIQPEPMVRFDRQNRRRAVLTARRMDGKTILGFSMRSSHALIDLDACPILVDALNQALNPLRDLLEVFEKVRGDIRINMLAADNGIDLAFSFSGKHPVGIVRALTTHKAAAGFLRLSLNAETVLERQRPLLAAGNTPVSPPPGAFVQASKQAEEAMAALVSAHFASCKKVADLFCGFGTFGLRLAEGSLVHACESDAAALKAMDDAWRKTGGKLKTLTHEKRDLFRRPMMAKELKNFDGLVFDPPRAGAEAQAKELAKSTVRRIAAVSCNPVTLARDVAILIAGGYRIVTVCPVDQFAHTPHLETVVLMER